MTPYEQGYLNTLKKLACEKVAGYWQNIVGFEDLDKFQKAREAALAAEIAARGTDFSSGQYDKYHGLRKSFIEDIGGEELGYTGKYVSVPEMVGTAAKEHFANQLTGEGYMSREDMLDRLEKTFGTHKQNPELWAKLQASTHPYFTSSQAF